MAAGVDGSGRPVAAGVRVTEIKRIVVWGLADAAVRHVFDMHLVCRGSKLAEIRGVGPVAAVAVTNAGHGAALLAAASQGIVRAWDTDTGAPRLVLPTANSHVRALAFGRAGDQLMLAAACQDGLLRVWDARSGQFAHQLRFTGHGFPTSVAFDHADGGARCWHQRATRTCAHGIRSVAMPCTSWAAPNPPVITTGRGGQPE